MGKKILILGVGNVLLKDEGLGVRALENLRDTHTIPAALSLVDGGVGGLTLLSVVRGYGCVIIIDAVRGGGLPGTVYRFEGKKVIEGGWRLSSLHGIGMAELLGVLELDGRKRKIVVIGMEPLTVSRGIGLSPLVRLRLHLVVKALKDELSRSGINLKRRKRAGTRPKLRLGSP